MATNGTLPVNIGSGANIAMYQLTEDAIVKFLQRIVFNDSSGAELFTTANPGQTSLSTGIAGEDATNNVLGITQKPVISAAYNFIPFAVFGTSVAGNIKPVPGNLMSLYCSNTSGAIAYLQIFNSTIAPVTSNVPILSFPIPFDAAGASLTPLRLGAETFGWNGLYMSSGLSFGISLARGTYSAATATNHTLNLLYI